MPATRGQDTKDGKTHESLTLTDVLNIVNRIAA